MKLRHLIVLALVAWAAWVLFVWSGGWVQAKPVEASPDSMALTVEQIAAYRREMTRQCQRLWQPYPVALSPLRLVDMMPVDTTLYPRSPLYDSDPDTLRWSDGVTAVRDATGSWRVYREHDRTLDSLETEIRNGYLSEELLWYALRDAGGHGIPVPSQSTIDAVIRGHDAERAWRRIVREGAGR